VRLLYTPLEMPSLSSDFSGVVPVVETGGGSFPQIHRAALLNAPRIILAVLQSFQHDAFERPNCLVGEPVSMGVSCSLSNLSIRKCS
jgi:hypothetical protein